MTLLLCTGWCWDGIPLRGQRELGGRWGGEQLCACLVAGWGQPTTSCSDFPVSQLITLGKGWNRCIVLCKWRRVREDTGKVDGRIEEWKGRLDGKEGRWIKCEGKGEGKKGEFEKGALRTVEVVSFLSKKKTRMWWGGLSCWLPWNSNVNRGI